MLEKNQSSVKLRKQGLTISVCMKYTKYLLKLNIEHRKALMYVYKGLIYSLNKSKADKSILKSNIFLKIITKKKSKKRVA